jgi:hypothetical protein
MVIKLRVYVDASVVGGCVDEKFKVDSLALWDKFIQGQFILVLSDHIPYENSNGHPKQSKTNYYESLQTIRLSWKIQKKPPN